MSGEKDLTSEEKSKLVLSTIYLCKSLYCVKCGFVVGYHVRPKNNELYEDDYRTYICKECFENILKEVGANK